MASITIKNLSDTDLKKINDKAKKNKISQQEYLRRLLKMDVMAPEIDEVIRQHEELMKACLAVIKENTEVMDRLTEIYVEG